MCGQFLSTTGKSKDKGIGFTEKQNWKIRILEQTRYGFDRSGIKYWLQIFSWPDYFFPGFSIETICFIPANKVRILEAYVQV